MILSIRVTTYHIKICRSLWVKLCAIPVCRKIKTISQFCVVVLGKRAAPFLRMLVEPTTYTGGKAAIHTGRKLASLYGIKTAGGAR